MTIKEKITSDIKEAMRAREQKKLGTLRLITAAIKQIEVDERIIVNDERMLVILDKLAKQRKESIEQFRTANRQDLIDQEEYELNLIRQYLPKPLSENEIKMLITQALTEVNAKTKSDMGKVMQWLKPKMQGKVDMSKVSELIKILLG